jgi:HAD superfamily hydrolase (TIGR01549 family)
MKKNIIIFDLDGVLSDSTDHVLQFFLNIYPTLTKDMVDEMLTGNFPSEVEKLKLTHKRITETEEQRKKRNEEYSNKKAGLPLHQGIKELLKALHNKSYTLVVNTSASERNCLPVLRQAGILDYFDVIATKELSVSKTEKFKLIADRYGLQPNQMIFITDTLGDIREADVANVPTVAVTWGAHGRSFFEREKHENLVKIVATVPELKSYLLSH